MTLPEFEPARRLALRTLLAEQVATAPPVRRRLPWWGALAAFIGAGLVAGGAVSAAAAILRPPSVAQPFTIGSPAGLKGVPAPAGTAPGTPIVSLLGNGPAREVSGQSVLHLDHVPPGSTDVRVTVTCLSAGTIAWGPDPSGNNPGDACLTSDVENVSGSTFYDFALADANRVIYLDVTGRWVVSTQYLTKLETAWGVNSHGQTYGVEKDGAGSPDLLAVEGTASDGNSVSGYALADQLQGPQPTSPADASGLAKKMRQQYPNGIPVPVYKSDGTTRIGTFYISTQ